MEVKKNGYLEIILGPMFSSKTSRIVDLYKQCKFCFIPVVIFNHSIDKRYHDKLLSTHDKIMVPCIQTDKLLDFWKKEGQDKDVILINEGQFFEDLYEAVLEMLTEKKTIYICGLDGDFERKKFGKILDLIPMCDKVTKNSSLCSLCKNGTAGIFSMRLSKEKEQLVVGSENYLPVCRSCYEK